MTDKPKCQEKTRNGWRMTMCPRYAVVDGKWCRQHDPEDVKRRHEEREAKWRKERADDEAATKERLRVEALRIDAVKVLKMIANGATNATALAQSTLFHHKEPRS